MADKAGKMRASEKESRWIRDSTTNRSGVRASPTSPQSGARSFGESKPVIGPSRFQVSASQRVRAPPRKPPEPLRRAVAACLSASQHASSEAVRTLQDHLANPATVDIAYSVLLDHAIAERDRSPPVVAKCVALLKRYLVRYVPKTPTLQQLDMFCANLIAECNSVMNNVQASPVVQLASEPVNPRSTGTMSSSSLSPGLTTTAFASGALVKSLTYIRALVARHLPNNSFQSAMNAGILHAQSKRSRSFSAQFGSGGILKRGHAEDKDAARSAVMHILGLEEVDEEDSRYIAVDVLKWRWVGGKRQQCWMPSPVMTDSGGIARPQVGRMYNFAEKGAGVLMLKVGEQRLKGQQVNTVERKPNPERFFEQLLQPSTVTTVTDSAAERSHHRAVAASKRQKPHSHQIWDFDTPVNTWRRRLRPLFHYKHYSEQLPLRLSDAEVEEVISAVFVEGAVSGSNNLGIVPSLPGTQTGRLAVEAADVAGSVLIKLLIDMYMGDRRSASPLTLSMLEGMLSSPAIAVRIRAFDLVLNIGVHAHLLEPMQIEEHSAIEEESTESFTQLADGAAFSSAKGGINLAEAFRAEERAQSSRILEERSAPKTLDKVSGGTPLAVEEFEIWLLNILFEMLLFLVQMEEADEGVWAAALSCLLYLICDRGRIQRERLHGIDIRVLRTLLDVSWENAWAEELHCRLICMMTNLLYHTSSPVSAGLGSKVTFDFEQLDSIGGIEFICTEYSRVNTVEARRNLFAIVLDYVLHELSSKFNVTGRPFPELDEIHRVVTALILADAPECLGLSFKQGLQGVGEGLAKSISTAMARDISSGQLKGLFLEEITGMIDTLVATYTHPDEEFAELLSMTMVSEGLVSLQGSLPAHGSAFANTVSQAWATLHALLHSPRASYRCHGYSWLLDLLSAEMVRGSIKKSSKLNTSSLQNQLGLLGGLERVDTEKNDDKSTVVISSAVKLLCGLLRSKYPSVRRGFVVVLERLLLKCQQAAVDTDAILYSSQEREVKQDGTKIMGMQEWANTILGLMNGALWQVFSANDTDRINILQVCNIMFSQLCIIPPPSPSMASLPSNAYVRDNMVFDGFGSSSDPANTRLVPFYLETETVERQGREELRGIRSLSSNNAWKHSNKSSSIAAMLLKGRAAALKILVASMPTALLYWPLLQLAGAATEDMSLGIAVGSRGRGHTPGGASDARAALLVLLIGKCTAQKTAFEEVGGEEFFRSLLDDTDARVAYYTSAFLLKRMMTEEPEKYQRMLHSLVFKAQQSNNEKLLENPYLQMRGILQLLTDPGSQLPFQEV